MIAQQSSSLFTNSNVFSMLSLFEIFNSIIKLDHFDGRIHLISSFHLLFFSPFIGFSHHNNNLGCRRLFNL